MSPTAELKCFVIMPFEPEFDDVYAVIKGSVEETTLGTQIRCYRLDDETPAGRITDRLLAELRNTNICVADISKSKPNVMWEVGYAMAVGKPLIIVTQQLSDMPFDLKDMQAIHYHRSNLKKTLSDPLKKMLKDTLVAQPSIFTQAGSSQKRPSSHGHTLDDVTSQLGELKDMISQLVKAWVPEGGRSVSPPQKSDKVAALSNLEGAWRNRDVGTTLYAKIVNGQLWVPYCYGGNSWLTAFYYDWRRTGEYWLARFRWIDDSACGFALLKYEPPDILRGAWWSGEEFHLSAMRGPLNSSALGGSGVPVIWERIKVKRFPHWANSFLNSIRQDANPILRGISKDSINVKT